MRREHLRVEVAGAAERRQRLRDRRDRLLGGVQAAVARGVVVPRGALERAREPERPARRRGARRRVPGQDPPEDHAKLPARSVAIASSSSRVCPRRIRSSGRRSPRLGFSPTSQRSATRDRIHAQQVGHHQLEQVDPLGVELVDALSAPPARDLRRAHAEQLGQPPLRAEVAAQGLHLLGGGDGHDHDSSATESVALGSGDDDQGRLSRTRNGRVSSARRSSPASRSRSPIPAARSRPSRRRPRR